MAAGRKTGGRQKGTPNKINTTLKEAILLAAEKAHPQGMTGYLTAQAVANPAAFMTLLGKVLPMQITGEGGGAVQVVQYQVIDAPNRE